MNTKMVQEMLDGGEELIDKAYMARMQSAILSGVDSTEEACDLVVWLMTQKVPGLTGRIISAVWDDWRSWDTHTTHFLDENVHTLRRNT
jgi:3-oxoacyl-[acyl-carrier protein] reductase